MNGSYDPLQVALSVLLAVAASYAALERIGAGHSSMASLVWGSAFCFGPSGRGLVCGFWDWRSEFH
jgi:NO-binding membrane sensor protein with MHYT domain